ncbi:Uncharacterized protein BM_BM2142 [Brugia malayi]|uniref:Calx-beta domain-containing protein n=3 Tax=Onchocercidae TaxID=6296 RepID=A0A4E9FMN8_BRUMA|nr:Uncharacterized protein BM_BM2142 [Brugia malayi]VIO97886.1 Uncharacterized protein BM_BM2142 [Brugia malayi]
MIIPIWRPYLHLNIGDRIFRGVIYFFIIAYVFLGVSIVADRFMSSIEVITSMERTVQVKRPGLEPLKVKVRIWNDTVSNLTLMALGSSAPEILLSIIEVIGKGFNAGDLGPNTIVGSAAFNLFMIIAICVMAVPNGEIRRQKHLDVFCVTATWSLFAYIWLYLILSVFSPGIIEIWEGLLTFLFFPITVLTAYVADIKIIQRRFMPHRYRRTSHGIVATEGEEMEILGENGYLKGNKIDPAVKAFEDNRKAFIEIMREIRKKNPQIDPSELQKQAEYEMISRGPKSRAFYRVQATRRLIGGGHVIRNQLDKEHHKCAIAQEQEKQFRENTCKIFFDPAHYTVLESVGTFDVIIGRDGGPKGLTVMVDYCTEDGTANAGNDYIPVKGTLIFRPEDKIQKVTIEIVDDDVFEEDEHFYLHLNNLRVCTKDGLILDPLKLGGIPLATLELPSTATVMILDDDHAGIFSFEHDHFEIIENCGYLLLKIQRTSGCRGRILVPYRAVDGTALRGKHYEFEEGEVIFEDNQTEAFIEIGITNTEQYERMDYFFIILDQPIWIKKMSDLRKIQERFLKRIERKKNESLNSLNRKNESFDCNDKNLTTTTTITTTTPTVPPVGFTHTSSSSPNLFHLSNLFKRRMSSWMTNNRDEDFSEKEEKLTKEELEIAELGKPCLGKFKQCQITIKESREFRSVIDRMLRNANASFMLGTTNWREQFIDALTVHAGFEDEKNVSEEQMNKEDGKLKPRFFDYFMHFLSLPWKLLFATIPPTDYWDGWACFIVSIILIGTLTAIIGDLASQFGCWIGLKDAVTAISFVALGTSIPDTFASKVAAIQDKYADSSIGNVTGSNGVNVFLGIGIAWTMAAVYHRLHGDNFYVEPGTLAFSVTIYCIEALICIAVIIIRRRPPIGGELGGPMKYKVLTSGLFVTLWLTYLGLSALESYNIISGF